MSETARTVITSGNGKVVTVIIFDSGQVAIEDTHGDALIPADCVQDVARALLMPTITPEDERVECLFNAMRDHFDLSMCRSILADDDVLWNGPTYAAECAMLYVVRDLEAAARQRATGSGVSGDE